MVYTSVAPDLGALDTNDVSDVYVYDRALEQRVRASVTDTGIQADGASYAPDISGDGSMVVFRSEATNLDPLMPSSVFARELGSGNTRTLDYASGAFSLRSDGSVAYLREQGPTCNTRTPTFEELSRAIGITQVAAAGRVQHTCAVTGRGKLYCWGRNQTGETGEDASVGVVAAPFELTAPGNPLDGYVVKSASTAWRRSCAVTDAGRLLCWGNEFGVVPHEFTAPGNALEGEVIESVSAGGADYCAVTVAGRLFCWGANASGQAGTGTTSEVLTPFELTGAAGPLAGELVASVSMGEEHTCAVTLTGRLYCWGKEWAGEVGAGTQSGMLLAPFELTRAGNALAGEVIRQVSTGEYSTCAVTDDQRLLCWGDNDYGQTGAGPAQLSTLVPHELTAPGQTLEAERIVSVAASTHACAVTDSGGLWCWGLNGSGEVGTGQATGQVDVPYEVTGSGGALEGTAVAAFWLGAGYSCALDTGGVVRCWGSNGYGEIGTGAAGGDVLEPQVVRGSADGLDGRRISAAAFARDACAVASAGRLFCWGPRTGFWWGSQDEWTVPHEMTAAGEALAGLEVDSVSVGSDFACALTTTGALLCWGRNTQGQIGNGSVIYTAPYVVDEPYEITAAGNALAGRSIDSVATGRSHVCAAAAGALLCWGYNDHGQIGAPDVDERGPYELTAGGGPLAAEVIDSVSTRQDFTCALTSDGRLYCWGDNLHGQTGTGSAGGNTLQPHELTGSGNALDGESVAAVSAGVAHACAVTEDGKLYCWGDNSTGQTGTSAVGGDTLVPYELTAASNALSGEAVASVSAGHDTTCAVTVDGKLFCWGVAAGTGAVQGPVPSPHELTGPAGVLAGQRVRSAHAAREYACALTTRGTLFCWGDNGDGVIEASAARAFLEPRVMNADCEMGAAGVDCIHRDIDGIQGYYDPTAPGEALEGSSIADLTVDFGSDLPACARATDGRVFCWGELPPVFGASPAPGSIVATDVTSLQWPHALAARWDHFDAGLDVCERDYYASSAPRALLGSEGLHLGAALIASDQVREPYPLQATVWPAPPLDISVDGQRAVLVTRDGLDPADSNGLQDVYLHDRATGESTLLSKSAGGQLSNYDAGESAAISDDGGVVAFTTDADNLLPSETGVDLHVLVWRESSGELTAPVRGIPGLGAYGGSAADYDVALSADGSTLAVAMPLADDPGKHDILVIPLKP